ncbi:MAG: Rieske 2Fe-2S domain-containing protein [Beijerinckiaceae bacterium]
MLTQRQNDLLTRTGPGTPGGRLLRAYWQPVALARDLPPGGDPLHIRVMSEDLVLFRDDAGRPGLLELRCPHRKADLSYGRIENGGLRCIYHGWLFDVAGKCIEQPGEPRDSNYKDRIRHKAYPCMDVAGLVLAYMGEGEPPALPPFPFFHAPEDHVWTNRALHECNYLQGNEGNIDPQHLSFLHRVDMGAQVTYGSYLANDVAPAIAVVETPWGLKVETSRDIGEGKRYKRYTNFVMPNGSSFVGVPLVDPKLAPADSNDGYSAHWHVPVDDYSHIKYYIGYREQGGIDVDLQKRFVCDGQDDDFTFRRTLSNRFLQDRASMRDRAYAGMGPNFQDHDRWVTESQGPIVDRTTENLGATDRAIILMRRQMLKAIEDIEQGRAPMFVEKTPEAYGLDGFFTGSVIEEAERA